MPLCMLLATLDSVYELWPARLLCPWESLGKYTGVGCHAPLQGIFPTQGLKLLLSHFLHWQVGSLLQKTQKDQKPNHHFWRSRSKNWVLGARAGHCARPLQPTPPEGWAHCLSPSSSLMPGCTLTLTPHEATWHLSSLPSAANKALPKFFVWPLNSFYLIKEGKEPWGQ